MHTACYFFGSYLVGDEECNSAKKREKLSEKQLQMQEPMAEKGLSTACSSQDSAELSKARNLLNVVRMHVHCSVQCPVTYLGAAGSQPKAVSLFF